MNIDNNAMYYCYFSQKNLNHIGDIFENNRKNALESGNNISNLIINEHQKTSNLTLKIENLHLK